MRKEADTCDRERSRNLNAGAKGPQAAAPGPAAQRTKNNGAKRRSWASVVRSLDGDPAPSLALLAVRKHCRPVALDSLERALTPPAAPPVEVAPTAACPRGWVLSPLTPAKPPSLQAGTQALAEPEMTTLAVSFGPKAKLSLDAYGKVQRILLTCAADLEIPLPAHAILPIGAWFVVVVEKAAVHDMARILLGARTYYPETEVSVRPPDAIAQELSDSDEILAVCVIMAREIDRMPRESSFLPKEERKRFAGMLAHCLDATVSHLPAAHPRASRFLRALYPERLQKQANPAAPKPSPTVGAATSPEQPIAQEQPIAPEQPIAQEQLTTQDSDDAAATAAGSTDAPERTTIHPRRADGPAETPASTMSPAPVREAPESPSTENDPVLQRETTSTPANTQSTNGGTQSTPESTPPDATKENAVQPRAERTCPPSRRAAEAAPSTPRANVSLKTSKGSGQAETQKASQIPQLRRSTRIRARSAQ